MAIDRNFVENVTDIRKLFDVAEWPSSTMLDYLLQQNFSVTFIDPRDKPKPRNKSFIDLISLINH